MYVKWQSDKQEVSDLVGEIPAAAPGTGTSPRSAPKLNKNIK